MTLNEYGMPYEPTWVDPAFSGLPPDGEVAVVYDQREGFQPAYAVISTEDADEAEGVACELTDGRLDPESETLVVRLVKVVRS